MVHVLEWRARGAISLTGVPPADRSDTNVCRSSDGVQSAAEPSGLGDDLELAADVSGVQLRAEMGAEDQVVILPRVRELGPLGELTLRMLTQDIDNVRRQEGAPKQVGALCAVWR
jgi:hypothetical protein